MFPRINFMITSDGSKSPETFWPSTGLNVTGRWDIFSRSSVGRTDPLIPSFSQGTFMHTKIGWAGNIGLPVIPSSMLWIHTCMKTERICLPLKPSWDINPYIPPQFTSIFPAMPFAGRSVLLTLWRVNAMSNYKIRQAWYQLKPVYGLWTFESPQYLLP